MTKKQWFLVAGTLVLAACGTGTSPCESDEQDGLVCQADQTFDPAQTPVPSINEPTDN